MQTNFNQANFDLASCAENSISRRSLLKLGAAGLAAGAWPGGVQAQDPGVLVMTIFPEPSSMLGAFNTASPIAIISSKMTEGLLRYDFDLSPQPHLATEWKMATDGLSLEFKLRQGVNWHDGKPFTSADVAYSIMEIIKVHHPRGRSVFSKVTAVETPDDYTAILRMSAPSPAIMSALSSSETPMLPKHVYAGTDVMRNPANNAPIGTGPYKFVLWQRGSHIILECNPTYWQTGKPAVSRLIVRTFTDAGARTAAFEAGELMLAGDGPIPLNEVKRFRQSPAFTVEERGMEMVNTLDVLETNLRNPFLAKREVRQALMHAIDLKMMVNTAWYGLAEALTGPIPKILANFYSADVPLYPYDIEKANKLLDAAGHPRGAGGMRFKLRLTWPAISDTYEREAQFLRQQFRKIGVDLDLQSADVPTFISQVYGKYEFDLNLFPASVTADPSIGLQRFYDSRALRQGTPFVNASGYSNPAMDKILDEAAVEMDPKKRQALFAQFQQIAMEDLPLLPLARPIIVAVASKKVKDFMTGAEGLRDPYANISVSA